MLTLVLTTHLIYISAQRAMHCVGKGSAVCSSPHFRRCSVQNICSLRNLGRKSLFGLVPGILIMFSAVLLLTITAIGSIHFLKSNKVSRWDVQTCFCVLHCVRTYVFLVHPVPVVLNEAMCTSDSRLYVKIPNLLWTLAKAFFLDTSSCADFAHIFKDCERSTALYKHFLKESKRAWK